MSMDWLGRRVLCCPPSVRATLQLVWVVVVVVVASLWAWRQQQRRRVRVVVSLVLCLYTVYTFLLVVLFNQMISIYLVLVCMVVYEWCMSGVWVRTADISLRHWTFWMFSLWVRRKWHREICVSCGRVEYFAKTLKSSVYSTKEKCRLAEFR